MRLKNKQNRGITLVALVITIIILLILAGVTISQLKENGLLGRANEAVQKHEEAAARERLEMALANMVTDKIIKPEYNEGNYLTQKLTEEGFAVNDNIVIVDGWQFEIDRSVPKIEMSLGKGEVNEEIKIEVSQALSDDYVKSTITAKIEYGKEIEYVQIAGEKKEDIERGEDDKYIVSKEVLANGKYSIYVKDIEGKYKYETIEVKEISENMNIDSAEKLAQFRDEVNKGRTFEGKIVELTDNVNLNGSQDNQWTPIGTDETNFKGTFDGNNHTIEGLYINNSSSNQGLFKYVDKDATIKNLTINGEMTSSSYQGGFAAVNYGIIENCINNAKLITSGGSFCGGIVANNRGIIYRCINNNQIISNDSNAGGIAGANGSNINGENINIVGLIIECINKKDINAYAWASGGIAAISGTHRRKFKRIYM